MKLFNIGIKRVAFNDVSIFADMVGNDAGRKYIVPIHTREGHVSDGWIVTPTMRGLPKIQSTPIPTEGWIIKLSSVVWGEGQGGDWTIGSVWGQINYLPEHCTELQVLSLGTFRMGAVQCEEVILSCLSGTFQVMGSDGLTRDYVTSPVDVHCRMSRPDPTAEGIRHAPKFIRPAPLQSEG